MLKKYFLLLSLLTLNHVVIYGASAAQGPLIADQKPLTDKEKRALLEFLNKSPFLTFTGSKKGDTFSLVPGKLVLKTKSQL